MGINDKVGIGKRILFQTAFSRMKKNKIVLYFSIFPISFAIPFIYCLVTHRLSHNQTISMGYLDDWTGFFGTGIFGIPFLSLFFIYYREKISKLLDDIYKEGTVYATSDEYINFKNKYMGIYRDRWPKIIAALIAVLMNYPWIAVNLSSGKIVWFTRINENGKEVLNLIGYYNIAIVSIFYFLLTLVLIHFIITIYLIKRISKFKIVINPIHPDGAGGLSKIGDLSLLNAYFFLIIGVLIVATIISDYYKLGIPILFFRNIFLIAGYLIISTISFFFPLYFFNIPMKREKEIVLNKFSLLFNEKYQIIHSNTIQLNSSNKELFSDFFQIKKAYDIVKEMPIWPFNFKTVRKFLVVILSPFTVFIFPYVIQKYILDVIFK